ncbi:hypothetical protein [Legionella antarctica]|nr:hypothetical protein [Legionella antarctica]
MLTSERKIKDGAKVQGKADEKNQLTGSHISIPFFKRKKTGYYPSARNPLGAAVKGREEDNPELGAGEEHKELPESYSHKAAFDRAQYESMDTGIESNYCEVAYKAVLISTRAKRERKEALADQGHDFAQDKCASLNCSI